MNEQANSPSATAPSALTDRSTHELLLGRVAADIASRAASRATSRDASPPPLRVLDAPAGAGAVAVRLRDLGLDVVCADIDPGNFEADGFDTHKVDLNEGLPFDDASFDAVVSVAGLQRLSQPDAAVAAFARVLKPGGRLYLAVPNFATLRRRLSFLLYGSLGPRFDRPKFRQTTGEPRANFRFPIGFPRVHDMIERAGLRIERIDLNPHGLGPFLALPLSLTIAAAGWVKARVNPKKYESYAASSSFNMLRARAYLITAVKAGAELSMR